MIKKLKKKIRKIITNWAYGLESQGLRYWKRYVRLHRKDEKYENQLISNGFGVDIKEENVLSRYGGCVKCIRKNCVLKNSC